LYILRTVPHRKRALTLLLALAASALSGEAPAPAPTLGFKACRLEHPLGLVSHEAECTQVIVPENRADPASRAVALFVARLPALSREHKPEPLFVLAGGPGLGAGTFYTTVAPAFARIRRERDIVLVDQRGTGQSAALICPFDEQQMWEAGEAETARVMQECRKLLAKNQDLAQYTTSVAVQDLDAVRAALGYSRIALYGSSYGTRVAQHYARRHPAQTLALVLDGVVPPTRILGPSTPLDAEAALQEIFARCRADRACATRFGDPEADYRELREKLSSNVAHLQINDPVSGVPRELDFSAALLAGALRLASYSGDQAALLPLSLHLANDAGQYGPLATQYLLAAAGYDDLLAYGMHNSVVCSEDVPFFAKQAIDREKLAATFLGTSQLDALQALCKDWPSGPIDADLHAPLASRIPALLLSGGADPVTPPAFGEEAAKGFTDAQHIVLPGQGHGQLLQPCVDRLMAQFIDGAAAGKPKVDAACLQGLLPPPFFISLNGPAP
jgi:pimeloyl-ACP methyl ester carboxylesterase